MSSLALGLVSSSVLLGFVLPMFRLPRPTGPYPTGTTILYLKDSGRAVDTISGKNLPRELMVQLWYPSEPSTNHLARYRELRETDALSSYQSVLFTNSRLDAPIARVGVPFPVILFNHGWRGRRTNDTFLTEELASYGYVVASIDHTYNASSVLFPDGRVIHGHPPNDIDDPENSTPERIKNIWDKELIKWAADQKSVLDYLEAMNLTAESTWYGRLNTNMAGAIGHSFGGAAATQICAEDSRVHAAVNMDGWFFGAIKARGSKQSLLFINAVLNSRSSIHTTSVGSVEKALDTADYVDTKVSLRKYGGYLLSVKGANHNDFTDQPLISPLRAISHRGTLTAQRVQEILRTYVVAFFNKTLRGETQADLDSYGSRFSETSLEYWPSTDKIIASEDIPSLK